MLLLLLLVPCTAEGGRAPCCLLAGSPGMWLAGFGVRRCSAPQRRFWPQLVLRRAVHACCARAPFFPAPACTCFAVHGAPPDIFHVTCGRMPWPAVTACHQGRAGASRERGGRGERLGVTTCVWGVGVGVGMAAVGFRTVATRAHHACQRTLLCMAWHGMAWPLLLASRCCSAAAAAESVCSTLWHTQRVEARFWLPACSDRTAPPLHVPSGRGALWMHAASFSEGVLGRSVALALRSTYA